MGSCPTCSTYQTCTFTGTGIRYRSNATVAFGLSIYGSMKLIDAPTLTYDAIGIVAGSIFASFAFESCYLTEKEARTGYRYETQAFSNH